VPTEAARTEASRFDLYFAPVFFGVALLLAFVAAAKSPEPAMQIQAWTVMGGAIAILLWFVHRYAKGTPADDTAPYANDVVKAGVVASMFWGIAGMLVGLIIALQLAFPNLFYFPDLPFTNLDGCARCTRLPSSSRSAVTC